MEIVLEVVNVNLERLVICYGGYLNQATDLNYFPQKSDLLRKTTREEENHYYIIPLMGLYRSIIKSLISDKTNDWEIA